MNHPNPYNVTEPVIATRVTRVLIDHDDDRLEATISVTRTYHPYRAPGSPSAADVPQDVRDALRAWLDGA